MQQQQATSNAERKSECAENANDKDRKMVQSLPRAIRFISPEMIFGSALHWIWFFAVILASFPFHASSLAAVPDSVLILDTLNVLPMLVCIATVILMAVFGRRITYYIRMRSVQICAAVMMAFGSVLLFQAHRLDLYPLILVGYIICGATAGFFTLIWSECFRRQETPSIVLNSALSMVVAFVSVAFLLQYLSVDITGIAISFLPLFQVTLLEFSLHGWSALIQPQRFEHDSAGAKVAAPGLLEIPTFHRLMVKRPLFILRMGVPSLLFGIAFGPLASWCFSLLAHAPASISLELVPFVTLLAGVLVLIVVILLLLLSRSDEYDSFYRFNIPVVAILLFFTFLIYDALALTTLVSVCFLLFLLMVWVEFCEMSHRYRISPILVTGSGFGFMLIGMLCGVGLFILAQESQVPEANSGFLTTMLIVMILLGYFLMPRARSIKEMAIIEGHDPGEDSKQGAVPENRGRFFRRCERVANTYLLSNREVDVFYLLAKGRNAAYIANKLYIAEGTVNTHTWRIYKKLNIHSQQELMELVDTTVVEDNPEMNELK